MTGLFGHPRIAAGELVALSSMSCAPMLSDSCKASQNLAAVCLLSSSSVQMSSNMVSARRAQKGIRIFELVCHGCSYAPAPQDQRRLQIQAASW